jgi:hypothetical protein
MKSLVRVILMAVVVSAVGCGGSKSTTAGTSKTAKPTVTSVSSGGVAQAVSICEKAKARIAAANYTVHNQRELANVAPLRAKQEKATVDELQRLAVPSAIAADWHRIIEYKTNIAEELAKVGRAAATGDSREMRAALASGASIAAQLSRIAAEHGLTACAQVS